MHLVQVYFFKKKKIEVNISLGVLNGYIYIQAKDIPTQHWFLNIENITKYSNWG